MKVYIGSDHGGFELKEKIKAWLQQLEYTCVDCGNTVLDPSDDYPDYAFKVGENVSKDPTSLGILICRSSLGVVVAANKVKGARAASCNDTKSAHHARNNDSINILGLSGDWIDFDKAKEIAKVFLETPFSNEERHRRRVEKIERYEKNQES